MKIKKSIKYITIFLFVVSNVITLTAQLNIGDPGVTFDNTKNDPKYPFMQEWQKSGVEGGVPLRNSIPIKKELNPTNSDGLQNAIDNLNTNGEPSVILLKNGTYTIDKTIQLKSNVVLRGESRENVKLNVTIRYQRQRFEHKGALVLDDVEYVGIENLTMEYIPEKAITIYDDRNVDRNKWCGDRCFGNDPDGIKNMYVSFVMIEKKSENCWIDSCTLKNSGSNPININGNHNTFRNNFVDAAYNKGGGGAAYYAINGDYNLIVNERVRRIRHFAIQVGAKYNVVYDCDFEVDINFHNGDDGFNLIENNKIKSEQWRSWGAFASGGSQFGHKSPGKNNIIFNNEVSGKNNSERFSSVTKVFVFDQYSNPRELSPNPPSGGTFYPVVLDVTTLSTEDLVKDTTVKIYPNPFTAEFTVKNMEENSVVQVFSINGRLIVEKKIEEGNKIDLGNELRSRGIYFLRYNSQTFKIVKE
ncbi:T9SS type A sorting domain-containing protein [Tenacibaculum agarivorans]|uniref:T9SS type A sorting domain-containing protein n=1 Tax=Tenacibaculum agarivorans TaxID=1908389 RepID=UPI00094B9E6B|nr:T9SS type A sorting domain-containing protein [Tenacibaculum agarivorans]